MKSVSVSLWVLGCDCKRLYCLQVQSTQFGYITIFCVSVCPLCGAKLRLLNTVVFTSSIHRIWLYNYLEGVHIQYIYMHVCSTYRFLFWLMP